MPGPFTLQAPLPATPAAVPVTALAMATRYENACMVALRRDRTLGADWRFTDTTRRQLREYFAAILRQAAGIPEPPPERREFEGATVYVNPVFKVENRIEAPPTAPLDVALESAPMRRAELRFERDETGQLIGAVAVTEDNS